MKPRDSRSQSGRSKHQQNKANPSTHDGPSRASGADASRPAPHAKSRGPRFERVDGPRFERVDGPRVERVVDGPRFERVDEPRVVEGARRESEGRRGERAPRFERVEGPRFGERADAPRATRGEATELVYGLRASLALAASRPHDVLEVHLVDEGDPLVAPLLKLAASSGGGIVLRRATEGALRSLVDTDHHEGVALRTRPRAFVGVKELKRELVEGRRLAIALDRVRNPYNIGAILRTAAFFGVDAAILGAPAPHPALPPDAVRVAEGGAEHLRLARTTDLAETLAQLRAAGVHVVGGENDQAVDAMGYAFPRPCVLVLGHEREGLSERVRAQCSTMVALRGSGSIVSLNVAIAASLLIGEAVRAGR